MCGIFGYVTKNEEALGPILIAAAEKLTYRGYDSVGAATLNSGKIDLRKDVGKVEEVSAKLNFAALRGQRGITQLCWATFGEPSQVNSQPHLDSTGDMVGAHNDNVVNNVELRLEFMAEGMTVRSQNDGETCVHAVERYIKRGYEFIDAIRLAYGDLQGDYAFVIGRANDDKLYAFKKDSGLVIGIAEGMLPTEFKHGPLSAVSKGFPIIFVSGCNDVPLIISGICGKVKVRSRCARTITIGEEDARLRANGDDLVVIPKSDLRQISALLGVLPLQLLSYHMSVMRGFDPDFPRNLSKTLTVD